MKNGKTLTFIGLFEEVGLIEIPIIQRDYAQGRKEEVDVRTQFLEALKSTLLTPPDHLSQPLDLDFVYGNFEGTNSDVFSVLDGQQRLTTLFLLHWYLAVKFNKTETFRDVMVNDKHSRFTYRTRPSTSEFFDSLVNSTISSDQLSLGVSLSHVIQDAQWFFLSWNQDPTVQSSLCMIDSIHNLFGSCEEELYSRLTNTTNPYVTFQYLNLQSFGLSDELYIKMNARGKALTDFENFKAWLFGRIGGWPMASRFEHKIDQEWTDIFWRMSQKGTQQFDDLYLRFFNLMAFYRACEKAEGGFRRLNDDAKNWLRVVRTKKGYITHRKLEQFDSFSLEIIKRIERILEYISGNHDEAYVELFESVLKSSDYVTQVQFYSFILFLERAPNISEWSDDIRANLHRWTRVTNNLINNHRIDELPSLLPTVRALYELSLQSNGLYEYLSSDDCSTPGFNKEQWAEECIKATLILKDSQWGELLEKYEMHVYLKGKVGFLLKMAEKDGSYSMMRFDECAKKAAIILGDEILTSTEFLLQRALLSFDNYLIPEGSKRYSFGQNNRAIYRERADNWLSVVGKPVFEQLIDAIDCDNVNESLRSLIAGVDCGGWRELLVRNPDAIMYCKNRLIHKDGNQIYLLTKSTFRGYHAELRSYVLKKHISRSEDELPEGIERIVYREVYGREFPGIKFFLDKSNPVTIGFIDGDYFAFDGYNEEYYCNKIKIPEVIEELLESFQIEEVEDE